MRVLIEELVEPKQMLVKVNKRAPLAMVLTLTLGNITTRSSLSTVLKLMQGSVSRCIPLSVVLNLM